ncbi:MAG: SOS response-associated peptidase [Pseudomonadota bacterium]
MCGRFAFYSPSEAISKVFGITDVPLIEPRYNVAPTQSVAAIRQLPDSEPKVQMLRWGLIPSWAKDASIGNKLINARGETVHSKPSFRHAFRKQRCLILVDGYYEWRAEEGGKQPYLIKMKSGAPFALAGLWEAWDDGKSDALLHTCTIVTTQPHPALADLHSRMPVIVPFEQQSEWMDPAVTDADTLRAHIKSFDGDVMTWHRVAKAVGNARNDEDWLINEV